MPLIQIKNLNGQIIATVDAESVPAAMEILALRGTSVANADLRSMNLSGRRLQGLQCPGADFSNANLDATRFAEAHLVNAKFRNVSMVGTHFGRASLGGATFEGVDPRGAVGFPPSHLAQATFSRSVNLLPTDPRSVDFRPPVVVPPVAH
jgi:uncharacterized protein YjbI with pentapeptide repeats